MLKRFGASLLGLVLANTLAAPAAPHFADYPAERRYAGKAAPLLLSSRQDKEFRSRLEAADKQRPNFSGHYIVTTFGCGAACVMSAFIDAQNGHIAWLPFTVCCGDYRRAPPVDFRSDSSLVIIRGMRNEQRNGTYYYAIKRGKLTLIAEYPE